MKKLLTIAFALLSISVFAQTKIGHLDYTELLRQMPEVDSAERVMMAYVKEIEDQIQMMQTDLETAYRNFQANQQQMTDLIRSTEARKIQDLEARLQEFYKNAQEDVEEQRKRLYDPIATKAREAVEAVAKDGKYSYILDSSQGNVLFATSSEDVIELVKKKLGIK